MNVINYEYAYIYNVVMPEVYLEKEREGFESEGGRVTKVSGVKGEGVRGVRRDEKGKFIDLVV